MSQYLCAQYLVTGIFLSVFYRPAIAGRKKVSGFRTQYLRKVMVEIAGLVCVVEHKKHCAG